MTVVELHAEVGGPPPGDLEDRGHDYWRFLEWLLGKLVRYREGTIFGLGIPLITVGEAEYTEGTWSWPITGGLLAARPGGRLSWGVRDGHLVGDLRGYHPLLPAPLYRVSQRPVHQAITRLFLLHERGRRHPPGVPAAPSLRLAAAAADAGIVLLAGRMLGKRRAALLAPVYLAASWVAGGQTPGQRLLGIRVVSLDGSPVTLAQAAARILALPIAALRLRALHDEVAGTEVVEVTSPSAGPNRSATRGR